VLLLKHPLWWRRK